MRMSAVASWRVSFLVLCSICMTTGCREATSPTPGPGPGPDPDSLTVRYSIWEADSYAGDGRIRFYWDANPFCDWPPCVPRSDIREVRVQISTVGPRGPYSVAASSTVVGQDSVVVDGVANGTLYYCRIASRDSSGYTIGISRVMETMPGPVRTASARIPAFQRYYRTPSLAWSPDGNQLAFGKADGCVQANLYAYDFKTAAIRQLTHFTLDEQYIAFADWSANGNAIVFEYSPTLTNIDLNYRIWTLDLATDSTRAVTSGRYDGCPAWVNDRDIVFGRYKESDRSRELYQVSLDGGAVTQITFDGRIGKFEPAVTIDGQTIAYSGADSGGAALFTVPVAGGDSRRLIDAHGWEIANPAWAPDGSALYFTTDWSGHYEIWSFDLNSRLLQQVTRSQARGRIHCAPAIDPSGTRLACFRSWGSQTDVLVYPLGSTVASRTPSRPGG